MRRPLMLVVNPVAGRSLAKDGVGNILETLYSGGYLPTVYFTEAAGQARELVSRNAEKYERVVCLGGDGTFSDVMGGMMLLPKEKRVPIGYIPMGTTNDMASTLGLPKNAQKAALIAAGDKIIDYDVGSFVDGGYFSYVAAFGAFTDVSYETSQESKNILGHMAYIFEGMSRLPKLTNYLTHVEYDGGEIDADLCFGSVSNTRSVAGVVKLDERLVELSDGMFEIILVKNPKNVQDLNNIAASILARSYNNDCVAVLQSSRVRFTFKEPVKWTRDGEAGGVFSDVILENKPGAVRIVIGE